MNMVYIEKLFHICEKRADFSVNFITIKTAALFLLREEAEKSSSAILTVSDIKPVYSRTCAKMLRIKTTCG